MPEWRDDRAAYTIKGTKCWSSRAGPAVTIAEGGKQEQENREDFSAILWSSTGSLERTNGWPRDKQKRKRQRQEEERSGGEPSGARREALREGERWPGQAAPPRRPHNLRDFLHANETLSSILLWGEGSPVDGGEYWFHWLMLPCSKGHARSFLPPARCHCALSYAGRAPSNHCVVLCRIQLTQSMARFWRIPRCLSYVIKGKIAFRCFYRNLQGQTETSLPDVIPFTLKLTALSSTLCGCCLSAICVRFPRKLLMYLGSQCL